MHLRLDTKVVNYRQRGVPRIRVRMTFYVDGENIGNIIAEPIIMDFLYARIREGFAELDQRFHQITHTGDGLGAQR
jgi:hypothetical protein